MLKEEGEFTDKIKSLFADIAESNDCFQRIPWYSHGSNDENAAHTADSKFWEWFDTKVSELDSTYYWDIANALKMK
jgi:hypothetical protein